MLLLPLTLSSCLKNKAEDLQRQEKDLLKKYLADNNITVAPTASGLYIVTDSVGTGAMPVEGEYVDFDYTLEKLDGELVIITTDSTVAKDNDIYSSSIMYGPERLMVGTNIQGLDEGLMSLKEGSRATLIMSSDLAWGNNPYSPVGSYSPVIIKVGLHRVLPDPAYYERSLINQFLANNAQGVDSTAAGDYVIERTAGTGDTADIDKLMTLNIKGSLLDGRVFLPTRQVRDVISTDRSSLVTEGLVDGIKTMRVGEKVTIIVPYYRGYLEMGKYSSDGLVRVPIPPYAALALRCGTGQYQLIFLPIRKIQGRL